MKSKRLPGWLKGGLIGLFIGIILVGLFVNLSICADGVGTGEGFMSFGCKKILERILIDPLNVVTFVLLVVLGISFLIGTRIGFITSKIKQKNKKTKRK